MDVWCFALCSALAKRSVFADLEYPYVTKVKHAVPPRMYVHAQGELHGLGGNQGTSSPFMEQWHWTASGGEKKKQVVNEIPHPSRRWLCSSALFLLYSNSFTSLLLFGVTIGSAELSIMMAQIKLGTNKCIFGFRIILGLNSQESSHGLCPLQSEWLTWKQRRHTNTYSCGQEDRKHKPKQRKLVICPVAIWGGVGEETPFLKL